MNPVISFDDIDEHGPQSYGGTFQVTPKELDRDELAAISPVAIEAHADQGNAPEEYVIEGTSKFTADLNCSRCLEPYPFANSSTFRIRFRPRPAGSGAEEEEIEITGEEELDVEFYSQREIPLRDLAVEQIQLLIPMKPLCDESCLGLCAKCGANRSREGCNCDPSIVDNRWDALRGIRDELSKKNHQ